MRRKVVDGAKPIKRRPGGIKFSNMGDILAWLTLVESSVDNILPADKQQVVFQAQVT